MLIRAEQCQLVLIDYQPRLMPAIHDGPAVLANAQRLADIAHALAIPVWGTEQIPDKLGTLAPSLAERCGRVLAKTAFSAAAELQPVLQAAAAADGASTGEAAAAAARDHLIVAGCEAHVCLLQTALALRGAGWQVTVVTDACGSRAPHNRDAAFARLRHAGCGLATTEMAGFEWLRDALHPRFRDWQRMIR